MDPFPSNPRTLGSGNDDMDGVSDFVKKLYKMLESPDYSSFVCWGPGGDVFVVKDVDAFTKEVLSKLFKHSNYASFVRQLNKYGFRKIKPDDEEEFGEDAWVFRHPNFVAYDKSSLRNIKRKVPSGTAHRSAGQEEGSSEQGEIHFLRSEVDGLRGEMDDLRARMLDMERRFALSTNVHSASSSSQVSLFDPGPLTGGPSIQIPPSSSSLLPNISRSEQRGGEGSIEDGEFGDFFDKYDEEFGIEDHNGSGSHSRAADSV